jgi:broad-specificity NMP kinase
MSSLGPVDAICKYFAWATDPEALNYRYECVHNDLLVVCHHCSHCLNVDLIIWNRMVCSRLHISLKHWRTMSHLNILE